MAHQTKIKQTQDNLELRTKRLIMSFRTFEHGTERYDWPFIFLVEVEEVQNGHITSGILRYENTKQVFFDDSSVSGLSGNYSHDSPFTKQFNTHLEGIMDEIEYAIEDHMAKKPAKAGITITDEKSGDYTNRLYLDLSQ